MMAQGYGTKASHTLPISTFLILELHVPTAHDPKAPPSTKGRRDFDLHDAQKIPPHALSMLSHARGGDLRSVRHV